MGVQGWAGTWRQGQTKADLFAAPAAEGRASRAAVLLRRVDERKAALEVERRRAAEAAAGLEQRVLELTSRLEAAQHRERAAAAEAERLRWVLPAAACIGGRGARLCAARARSGWQLTPCVCPSRSSDAKSKAEASQLSGVLSQLEVAEAALRDSQVGALPCEDERSLHATAGADTANGGAALCRALPAGCCKTATTCATRTRSCTPANSN